MTALVYSQERFDPANWFPPEEMDDCLMALMETDSCPAAIADLYRRRREWRAARQEWLRLVCGPFTEDELSTMAEGIDPARDYLMKAQR